MYKWFRRRRGINSVIASVILIAIVVMGGLVVFSIVNQAVNTRSPGASLRVEEVWLVQTQEQVAFTITIKNAGGKPISQVNVTLDGEDVMSRTLSEPLPPGSTTSLSPTLKKTYIVGQAYIISIASAFSDGSTFATSSSVTCTGTGNPSTQFKFVILSSVGGTTSPAPGTYWYDPDTLVNITAIPSTNYALSYWRVNSVQDGNQTTVTLNANDSYTVLAQFTLVGNVTANVVFNVVGVGDDTSSNILTVDSVGYPKAELPKNFTWIISIVHTFSWFSPVSAGAGKRYAWTSTGGLSADQSGTIVVPSGGGTVNATYRTDYLVNITCTTGGTTSPSPELYWWQSGSTFNITAIPGSAYVFARWEINEVSGGAQTTLSLTVNATYHVHAVFTLSTVQVTFQTSGMDTDASGVVLTVDSTNYVRSQLPKSFDWVIGLTHSYSYVDIVSSTVQGKRYNLTGTTGTPSPITVTSSETITGNYEVQWQVTFDHTGLDSSATGTVVTVNGDNKTYSQLSYAFWIKSGETVTYSFTNLVTSSTGDKRFDLTGVTGLTSPITVSSATNVTGNYIIQWQVTFDHTGLDSSATSPVVNVDGVDIYFSTPLYSKWVNNGASLNYSYFDLVTSSTADKRFSKLSVIGSSSPISVLVPVTVTGNYVTQWNVTFTQTGLDDSAVGTVVTVNGAGKTHANLPTSEWYGTGDAITYTFENLISSSTNGKHFSRLSVSDPSSPFFVSSAVVVAGNYGTQWNVTFTYAGLDDTALEFIVTVNGTGKEWADLPYSIWADDGSGFTYNYSNPVPSSTLGKQFNLTEISGPNSPFTLVEATTVTGIYGDLRQVTFTHSGLDPSATGTVVTVNGTTLTYANLTYSIMVSYGSTISYSYSDPVSSTTEGKRFDLVNVIGSESPITVTSTASVTGNYTPQWNVTFTEAGLDSSATGTVVTINSVPKTHNDLPFSNWYDNGTTITYLYSDPALSSTDGKRFDLTNVSGPTSPIVVSEKVIVTGNYVAQYNLTITVTPSAGGSTNPVAGQYWYDSGANVQVTAIPAGNYQFDRWILDSNDVGSANPINVTMDQKHVLEAKFNETGNVVFRVNGVSSDYTGNLLTVDGTNYVLSNLPTFAWNIGSLHSLTWITPCQVGTDKKYVWSSTVGLTNASNAIITIPSGGGDVNATYGTEFRLLASTADLSQGTTNPSPGEYWYTSGSNHAFTAAPNSGFAFDYWSFDGATNTSSSITVTMNTNHTLVANFMTARFYNWTDGTQSDTFTMSYNLYAGLWTHDANASYGIISTGINSQCNVSMYLDSISNQTVVENVTLVIRNPSGTVVATVTWEGGSFPTPDVNFALATNTIYIIEVWIKGKATVSNTTVTVKLKVNG